MKRRLLFLIILFLVLGISFLPQAQSTMVRNEEEELFLVAQKAFDDSFYDVAIRYLNQYFTTYPLGTKRIQAKLLLGQCYFFKTQYLKAFEIFKDQLQHPEYKDITLFWLGETYLKGRDYPQAEKQYRQIIEVYPNSFYAPHAFYSLAWVYYEQKDYKRAKEKFLEFSDQHPTHQLVEDALFKVGECSYNSQDYNAAIQEFRDYIQKLPQSKRHDRAYFYMGESYYYLEDFVLASEYYQKSFEISNDDKIILMSKVSLGWCSLKQNNFEKALQLFDDAQSFSQEKNIPSDDIYLGKASLFLEMKENEKSLEAYDQLIENFPDTPRLPEAYLGRANVLYLLEQHDKAVQQYQLLIDQFGKDQHLSDLIEKAYFGLAWAYLKKGSVQDAIKNFNNVINFTKSKIVKISALSQIGDAYQDINDLGKAIETYDKILKDFPHSLYTDYIQYRLGIALLKMDNIDGATIAFKTLKENFPQSKYLQDIKYYLGVAYFKKGDWASAKIQIGEFIDRIGDASEFSADAQYILALSMFNLKEYDMALKYFNKIIKTYPDRTSLVRDSEINIAKCLYGLGDIKEALKRFKIIAYKYPKTPTELEVLLWISDYYLKALDYDNSILYYRQILAHFPESEKEAIARYGLGEAYMLKGEYDEALNQLKLIDEKKDPLLSSKAKLLIAEIFSKQLDPATAIKKYRTIAKNSPEFERNASIKISELYMKAENFESALQALTDALKASPEHSEITNAELQFRIGDSLELMHKRNEAIEAYLKIPYLYPDRTTWVIKAYLRIAKIFEDEEDWENAKLVYNKIIDYGTDEVKFAQERIEWINTYIQD